MFELSVWAGPNIDMYIFLTLDPVQLLMTSHGFTSKLGPVVSLQKWWTQCSYKLVGSAGVFQARKTKSGKVSFRLLRYRIHIRASPSPSYPPIHCCEVGQATPKNRSRRPTGVFGNPKRISSKHAQNATPKHWGGLADSAWKLPSFHVRSDVGQFAPGSDVSPSSMAEVYGFPMIYIVIYCVCVFFFFGGGKKGGACYGSKKISIHKKCQQLQPKSPGKSMIFQLLQAVCLATTSYGFGPRVLLRKCQKWMWQWARPGKSGYPRISPDGHLSECQEKTCTPKMVRMMTTNKKYILQISELLFWSVTLEWTRQKGRTIWCLLNYNDDLLIDQNSGSKFRFTFASGSATFSKMASAKCTLVEGHGWVPNSGFGDRGVVFLFLLFFWMSPIFKVFKAR